MTKPAITYGHGFLTDCNSYYDGTGGTADSGDITHTVDTERTEGTDDYWNGCFIKYLSGPNVGLERKITDFDEGTDTITHDAFPNAVAVGHTYIISSWGETEDGNITTLTINDDDIFQLHVTVSGSNKICYYSYPQENGTSNLTLSSSIYTKIFYRYHTALSGVAYTKAKILLVFYGWNYTKTELENLALGNGQIILAETNSATWITGSTTITSGKIIDHIRLYANGNAGLVYYDFALICKGVFTFPNTEYGSEFTPPARYADIEIPTRITDITQNLGSPNATWTASCNLDIGKLSTTPSAVVESDWKRPQGQDAKATDENMNGQVFVDIAHNSITEPFQWLDTGEQQFKVTLDTLRFPKRSDSHTVDLTFKEYSRSSKSNESYVERFGLNL